MHTCLPKELVHLELVAHLVQLELELVVHLMHTHLVQLEQSHNWPKAVRNSGCPTSNNNIYLLSHPLCHYPWPFDATSICRGLSSRGNVLRDGLHAKYQLSICMAFAQHKFDLFKVTVPQR